MADDGIGGYFGLECGAPSRPPFAGAYVNSSRNALRLILRTYGVRRLWLPAYTCPVVNRAVEEEGCAYDQYGLDADFLPDREFGPEDFVVYNNYFGVCGKNVAALAARYRNLLVDNAQACYARPVSRAAFYSPRKFFGLPDGGIAAGEGLSAEGLPQDRSVARCGHLLKRLDTGAESGYGDFHREEDTLLGAPVRAMSSLTAALMGGIDWEWAKARRLENFRHLDAHLKSTFPFVMSEDDVPMVYPYVTDDPGLRKRLIANRIFVATYWPDAVGCDKLRDTILPLPIDQRYGRKEMDRILEVINAA